MVYTDCVTDVEVAFEGIKRRFRLQDLTPEALTTLAAGESLDDEFDIARTSDLSHGGSVTLRSSGIVPLVEGDSVFGYLRYRSNSLTIEIDAVRASQIAKAVAPLRRRTNLSCSNSTRKGIMGKALNNTVSLANAAAHAAVFGSTTKFTEYFKTTANATRQVVAARLQAVAKEAGSTTSGATTYYCADAYGYCETNVLAYTLPALNVIANCDIYYSYLPAMAGGCHDQDQATTSLHEFTHAPGVYSPGTEDLGYGYVAATALSSSDAVMNADTYALYANGKFRSPLF
jgi:deuterolysin